MCPLLYTNTNFSSIFYSNIILSIILFIPLVLTVIFLDKLLNISIELIPTIKILFSLIFASFIIRIVSSVFGVVTFAKNRVELRGYVEIIKSFVRVVFYMLIFNVFLPNIIWVGVVSIIVETLNVLFYFKFTKTLLPDMKIKKSDFSIPALKVILSSGIWNSINQLGTSLMYSIDLIIANVFLGAYISGELAIVHLIPNIFLGIISTLVAVFLPKFTENYVNNNMDRLVKEVINSQIIMAIIVNSSICVFIGLGKEFFSLWIPNNNIDLINKLSIITISHLLMLSITWPISNLNIIINKIKIPSLFMIFNGILNLIFSIILIKFTSLGVYSMPITTTIISILWYIIFVPIYPCKFLGVSPKRFYITIFKVLCTTGISIVLIFIIKSLFTIDTWLSLIGVSIMSEVVLIIINVIFLTPIIKYLFTNKNILFRV